MSEFQKEYKKQRRAGWSKEHAALAAKWYTDTPMPF